MVMKMKLSDIPGHSSIPEDYTGGCLAGGDLSDETSASLEFDSDLDSTSVNETPSFGDTPSIRVNEEGEKDLVRNLLLNKTIMQGLDLVAQVAKPILGVSATSKPSTTSSTGLLGAKTFRINTTRLNTTRLPTTGRNPVTQSIVDLYNNELGGSKQGLQELRSLDKSKSKSSDEFESTQSFEWLPPEEEMLPMPLNSSDKTHSQFTSKTRLTLSESRSRSRPGSLQPVNSSLKTPGRTLKFRSVNRSKSMVNMSSRKVVSPSASPGPPDTWGPTIKGTIRTFVNMMAPTMECDFDENAVSNPEELKLDHSKGTAIGTGGYSWVTEYVIIFFPPVLLASLIVSDIANACTKGSEWMSAWTVFWALFRIASAVFMATCFHAYLHIISTPTVYHALPLPVSCAVIALAGPFISSSFYFTRWWCLSVILGLGSAVTIHSVSTMLSSGEAFFLSYDLGSTSMGMALKSQIKQNLKNWFVSLADIVTVFWLVYPFIELARVAAEQMNADWGVLVASLYKISVFWLQISNMSGMFRDLSSEICLLNLCYPLVRHFLLNSTGDFTAMALLYTILAASFFFTKPKEFRSSPGFVLLFSLNVWFYGFDGFSMLDILFGWRYIVFWHVFSKFSHWVQRMRHSLLYRMAYCHDMSVNTKEAVKTLHSLNCQHFIRFENWFLNFVMHCLKVWDVTILLRMARNFKPVRYEEEELRIRLGTQMLNTSMMLTFTGFENNGKVGVFKFKNMMFPLAAPTVEYLREMTVKVDLETRMLIDFNGTMDTYSLEMLRFCIHEHQPAKAVAPTIDFIYKLRQKHPQVKRMFKEYERKFHCDINKYGQKISVKKTGWSRMAAILDTLFAFGTHPVVHGFGGSYEEESLFGTHTHAMTHGNNFLGESSNFVIATLCASHVPVEAISLSVVNNEQNFPETFFKGPGHAKLRQLADVSLLAKIHNITIDNLRKVWATAPDAPYKPSDRKMFRKMAVYFINNSIMHSLDHALQYKISSFRHYINDLDFHRYQPAAISARYLTEQIPGTGERTSNWAPYVGWVQEWHTLVVADMKKAGIYNPKEAEAKYGLWGDIEDVDLCIDF